MYIHQIEADDTITWVNDAWLAFARENNASHLTLEAVLGHSLWNFITEATTRQFYQILVQRVRSLSRIVTVHYRCDSPEKRRYMQMEVQPLEQGRVRFCSKVLREEPRPALELLASPPAAGGPLVIMCSWCKRIHDPAGERWIIAEDAINQMKLFYCVPPPQITHGICPECAQTLEVEIENLD